MTVIEFLTFLVSCGALGAGWRAAHNSGKFVQKFQDHIESDDRRFHEQSERIDKVEDRLWGHRR